MLKNMKEMFFHFVKGVIVKRIIILISVFFLLFTLFSCSSGNDEYLSFSRDQIIPSDTSIDDNISGSNTADHQFTICIDPGHGFEDGGASSSYTSLLEKDITLAISNKLSEALKSNFNVVFTHDGITIPKTSIDDNNNKFNPQERATYINSLENIDYLISLHCNLYDGVEDVSGTRIYYYDGPDKNSENDKEIADIICKDLNTVFPQRVPAFTESQPFYVIKYINVPASLIEMGFMTSENDVKDLTDENWQNEFVKSVSNSLKNYFYTENDND